MSIDSNAYHDKRGILCPEHLTLETSLVFLGLGFGGFEMENKEGTKPERSNKKTSKKGRNPRPKDDEKRQRSTSQRNAGQRGTKQRSAREKSIREVKRREREEVFYEEEILGDDYLEDDFADSDAEYLEEDSHRNRQDPWRRESNRRGKRASAGKKRSGGIGTFIGIIFFLFAFGAVIAGGYILLDGFMSERPIATPTAIEPTADFDWYFRISGPEDLGIVINNQVMREEEDRGMGGRIFDGEVYLDLSVINRQLNGRFYWDAVEQLLIHTLPYGSIVVSPETHEYTDHGESRSENFNIIRMEGENPFVALAFIQRFANIEYSFYEEPSRVVLTTQWGERSVTNITSDAVVRWFAGPESDIVTGVESGEEVFFLEEEGYWRKIATFDGFLGYVLSTEIDEIRLETFERAFQEPVFTQIVREGPINVSWDNDLNHYTIGEALARAQGLTAVAPMWLSIADTDGNIDSTGTIEYVQIAHQAGVEVWVVLRDFHGGISSYNETYQVLSRTSSRRQIIEQTVAETLRLGADGINLDLELVPFEAGAHFVQFVREMSVEARSNGLVLSVANFYPLEWRLFMNLSEQARVVDYIILMGYDEHGYGGGRTVGPVASFDFVRNGIESSLREVPANMLINALPFYSRLWYVVPMTEEEIAQGDGQTNHISSVALGLDLSTLVMLNSGVEMEWDPITRMYYAQWEDPYGAFRGWLVGAGALTGELLYPSGGIYRMWLEDERSLREKLQVMRDFNLAGVGSWQLGLDSAQVWEWIGEFY